jgi:ATP-dependent exoDNAse (exonuclease V) beta subunit
LFLHASKGVLFVVAVMEWLVNPDNQINNTQMLDLWLNWLKPLHQNNSNYKNWTTSYDLNEVFETELGKHLEEISKKLLLSSLNESITRISSYFGIFKLSAELPFLQTLMDKAGELKSTLSNDISNFLLWWNEIGQNISVNVNDDLDAIRLLTVHKSKGLEFKAVLIPYFNWSTSWSSINSPLLWCIPKSAPFNHWPLLPIKVNKELTNSEFRQEYYTEKLNYLIDSMNLVYVAFTRAKSALFIQSPQPHVDKKGEEKGSDTGRMLLLALRSLVAQSEFSQSFDADEEHFEFGKLVKYTVEKEKNNTHVITSYAFNDFTDKIQLRSSGDDFLVQSEQHTSEKNLGKIVHEILAEIELESDVEEACNKALRSGKILPNEFNTIYSSIKNNLNISAVKSWFNGTYTILNERNVLDKTRIHRPDRIMTKGEKSIVVDYKTGEKHVTYNRQIERYTQALASTGFKHVEGYLWYLNSNEVEKVV